MSSNSTISVDPRIIPLVRSLKEHTTLNPSQNTASNKITQDITSSEKTAKMKFKENLKENNKIENEKNKTDEIKKAKKPKNSITRFPNKSNTVIRKKSSTKISIDGSVDNKMKSGTSDKKRVSMINTSNKIKVISKEKIQNLNPTSTFHLTSQNRQKKYNYNNIKTRYFFRSKSKSNNRRNIQNK